MAAASDEIVVTAHKLRQDGGSGGGYTGYRGSGYTYDAHSGAGGGNVPIAQAQVKPVNDYKIEKTDDLPEIKLKGLTNEQFDQFLQEYSNISRDAELSAQMKTLANNGTTLTLTISEQLFNDSSADARAGIKFIAVGDIHGENQVVAPGSDIEIVVKGSKITNVTWEDTFQGIIAHEFTHLKQDDHGVFLKDNYDGRPGETAQDADDETYENLTQYGVKGDFSHLHTVSPVSALYGPKFAGTNGNDYFDLRPGVFGSSYTGGGNDIILASHSTMDSFGTGINVDGGGKKIVVGESYVDTFDFININTISTAANAVLTQVGHDLYVTQVGSGFAVQDDPNAVIIIDQYRDAGESVMSYIGFADYSTISAQAPTGYIASSRSLAFAEPKSSAGEAVAVADDASHSQQDSSGTYTHSAYYEAQLSTNSEDHNFGFDYHPVDSYADAPLESPADIVHAIANETFLWAA